MKTIKFNSEIKAVKTVNEILNNWVFSDLLTPAKKRDVKNGKISLIDIKKILIDINTNKEIKKAEKIKARKELILSQSELKSVTINVEWTKSRTWGANPKANINFCTVEPGSYQYLQGSSVSGCGYCKQSTAVAEVLNMCTPALKLVLKNAKKLPYGVQLDCGNLPRFNGGVGVECYVRFFNTVGYDMKKTGNGKMFDSWTIEKMSNARKKEYKQRGY
jgi:hypothetical protein